MGADPAKRRGRGACAAVTTLPVCGWADWRVSAGGATGAQPGNDATATQAAAAVSDAANVAVAGGPGRQLDGPAARPHHDDGGRNLF